MTGDRRPRQYYSADSPAAATGDVAVTGDAAVWRVRGTAGVPLIPGSSDGPLRGLRVAVKDLFAVRGQRVGGGNPSWLAEAAVEAEHAAVVAALLDAGADVVGIAQTDELAYSVSGTNVHYGTPPNPAAPGRAPGGSTSGPASAVALGEADVGLGTDTAGSVRVPASYCGLAGVRTTHGSVATAGVLPLAPSFDTVGWLARDVATLARVGDVLLPPARRGPGPSARPRAVPGSGPVAAGAGPSRLLVAAELVELAEPAVGAAVRTALPELSRRTGLGIEEVPALDGIDVDGSFTAFRVAQGREAAASHGAWVSAHPGALGPGVADRFAVASQVTAEQAASARGYLAVARQALRAAVEGAVLVLPATSSPAPPAVGLPPEDKDRLRGATLRLTCLASLAGLPCVVLPGLLADGLPVGLALVGAAGSDRALLGLAARARGPADA